MTLSYKCSKIVSSARKQVRNARVNYFEKKARKYEKNLMHYESSIYFSKASDLADGDTKKRLLLEKAYQCIFAWRVFVKDGETQVLRNFPDLAAKEYFRASISCYHAGASYELNGMDGHALDCYGKGLEYNEYARKLLGWREGIVFGGIFWSHVSAKEMREFAELIEGKINNLLNGWEKEKTKRNEN